MSSRADAPGLAGPSSSPRPSGLFYGWYLVVAVGFVLTTVSGLCFYNLSVLLKAFVAERGFPVSIASGATATFFIASGIGGITAGRLIDRFDPRIIIVAGALLASATLALVGAVTRPWQLYLFHLVFGFAYGGCGLVPGTTLVARWFERRRSLALSMASTGLSLGGIVITPASAFLIEKVGLTAAGHWLALVFLVGVVPVTALVFRARPQSMGLLPDGAAAPEHAEGRPAPQGGMTYSEAVRHPFFIGLIAAYILALGSQVGALSHLFRLASLRADNQIAAAAVASLAAASITGRLTGGWLLLKISARGFALTCIALQSAAMAFLAFAQTPTAILAGAVLFGLNVGNVLMMQALLLAETFGTRDYGRIYATGQMATMVGMAGGPFLVGFLYEVAGGYRTAYLAAGLISAVGCAVLALASLADRRAVRT